MQNSVALYQKRDIRPQFSVDLTEMQPESRWLCADMLILASTCIVLVLHVNRFEFGQNSSNQNNPVYNNPVYNPVVVPVDPELHSDVIDGSAQNSLNS